MKFLTFSKYMAMTLNTSALHSSSPGSFLLERQFWLILTGIIIWGGKQQFWRGYLVPWLIACEHFHLLLAGTYATRWEIRTSSKLHGEGWTVSFQQGIHRFQPIFTDQPCQAPLPSINITPKIGWNNTHHFEHFPEGDVENFTCFPPIREVDNIRHLETKNLKRPRSAFLGTKNMNPHRKSSFATLGFATLRYLEKVPSKIFFQTVVKNGDARWDNRQNITN